MLKCLPLRLVVAFLLLVVALVVYLQQNRREPLRNVATFPAFEHNEGFTQMSAEDEDDSHLFNASLHRKLYSISTSDREYFRIDWGSEHKAYNPNIIPHPTRTDTYIIAGHQVQVQEGLFDNNEIACNAKFTDGILKCTDIPSPLPVQRTEGHCRGDEWYFNLRGGPRDARMFYGPHAPYLMFGSLATHSCLGLFVQDLSVLRDEGFHSEDATFPTGIELQRPPPYATMQKNWFLFWDANDQLYVHHDIFPQRTFARLSADGSIGEDLSVHTTPNDDTCIAKYMLPLPEDETIHQATNSLSITLCSRTERTCQPNDDNTFLMTIVHHQTFHDWHGQYYGHVVLFKQTAPFELHAVSRKGLWINGKKPLGCETESMLIDGCGPPNHDELFYINSMSWVNHNQTYHGYIDDPLFLAFGIEDVRSGGIDVLAGDILRDLAFCANIHAEKQSKRDILLISV